MRWISHPLRPAACLLIAGIILYKLFPLPLYLSIIAAAFFLFAFFLSAKFFSRFSVWAFCLAVISVSYALMAISICESHSQKSIASLVPPQGGVVICEGRVGDAKDAGNFKRLIVDGLRCLTGDELQPTSGRLRLTVKRISWFNDPRIEEADVIRFRANIRRPRDFMNFNRHTFETYCLSKGISATGFVWNPRWIVKMGREENSFLRWVYRWKRLVARAAFLGLGNSNEFHLIRALVLGDKSGFSKTTMEDFRTLGIIHLLVVSGLHVAVLAGISWWLVILLGVVVSPLWGQGDLRPAASIISLMLIWMFISLTGFGTPAVRAGLIATVYLGSILFQRRHNPWDTLTLAAIVILILNPPAVFDISFQLTFAAVVGILAISRFAIRPDTSRGLPRKILCVVANMGVVSIGASAGVFPLLAYHFGKIPTLGPLLNIFISPLVTVVIVPLSLIAAMITPLSISAGVWAFGLLKWPAKFLLGSSEALSRLFSWSAVDTAPSLWSILTLYGFIAVVIYWRKVRHRKLLFASVALFGVAGLFMPNPLKSVVNRLAVTFLDVGQGASVVVRAPNGSVTLIDGGGIKGSSFDTGKSIIEPFLKRIDAEKVERLIVTHPHPDHFIGLGHIAEVYHPEVMMVGSYPEIDLKEDDASEWKTLLDRVEDAGVKIERIEQGVWKEEGVEFNVYSPPEGIPEGWSVNDASAIIKISYGDVSFLITGDAEALAENYVLENKFDIKSTVLQIPHHGSATSSTSRFLDKVSPMYGIIQVGAFNKYGFPEEEVLERLEEYKVKYYRTDIDGAVMFVTDGKELKIFSVLKK